MVLNNVIRTKLWNDGMWIAASVPKINMELYSAMELVQNEMDVTTKQVKHTLKCVLDILVENEKDFNDVTKDKLIKLFNDVAGAYSAPYRIVPDDGELSGVIGHTPYSFEEFCSYFLKQD